MAATQRELALQMVAQLRLLDPSISAEVGTPERKIIDTVAQSLYENQVDLDSLSAGLDIDSKYGAQLDRFLSIFGFARQKATFATGYVIFSRTTAANVDVRIPAGATIKAPALPTDSINTGDVQNIDVPFSTLFDVFLPAGSTETDPVPVRATIAGVVGNVASDRITAITGSPIFGITAVTNEVPTGGGKNSESDEEFKVRFKNTVFRNLAGTQDQYMALAIATAYTTKASVVGPQSRWSEYIQVPPVADSASYDVTGQGTVTNGNGAAGDYTTALSQIPYAKYIYKTEFPAFVSNGKVSLNQIFYRQDGDFVFNYPAFMKGDSYRFGLINNDPIAKSILDGATLVIPNVTFKNVYTGVDTSVTAIRPNDVVLLEYSYMSSASRNDITKNITNAVDVYIDGSNVQTATTITVRPTTATAFVDNVNSKYHYENFRRTGNLEKRPIIGNVLMQLFWQPVLDVPDQIVVGTNTYFKGVHYWAVEDYSPLRSTIRARSGIEWSTKVNGKAQTDNTTDPSLYTGKIITDATGDPTGGSSIEVDEYSYDRNIVDLQAALEGSKQITTDVLAHKAKTRYFKLDLTIMYTDGANVQSVNASIQDVVDSFLRSQYFGSIIQLSDLIQVVHGVTGVDNVRWTNDYLGDQTAGVFYKTRVYETDRLGNRLTGWITDDIQIGTTTRPAIQGLYLNGQPTNGNYGFTYNGVSTNPIAISPLDASTLTAAFATYFPTMTGYTITEDSRSTTGVRYPIRSFRLTYSANGSKPLVTPSSTNTLSGGPHTFQSDFFLLDDELARLPEATAPGDTLPGLIIRARSQNTWIRV